MPLRRVNVIAAMLALALAGGGAIAQDKKDSGGSDLNRRVQELIAEAEAEKKKDKSDEAKPRPAEPTKDTRPTGNKLPGFSEVVRPPPVPKPKEPARTTA